METALEPVQFTQSQKAAILVMYLERETSKKLLARLSDDEVRAVGIGPCDQHRGHIEHVRRQPRGHQFFNVVNNQRFTRQRQQRLGAVIGQRRHPGAATGGENHGFHSALLSRR